MSWSAIRTELVSRLSAIDDVNNVYGYRRHHKNGFDDPTFRTLFTVADGSLSRLEGWFVEHKGMPQRQCEDDDSTVIRTHNIEIFGFRSLVDADASANTFIALVEAIEDDLNTAPRNLDGNCLTHGLLQAGRIDTAVFYDHLCHTVLMTLEIEELV